MGTRPPGVALAAPMLPRIGAPEAIHWPGLIVLRGAVTTSLRRDPEVMCRNPEL